MFVNAYEVTLENAKGETVQAALRLTIGAQIKLKKKYAEPTAATLFGAIDDPEKLVSVLDEALTWSGHENVITSGEALVDLLACNGKLGMIARQRLMSAIGEASGVFSSDEKKKLDEQAEAFLNGEKNE